MNETIELMKRHVSVRSFTGETIPAADLTAILEAGQAASSWKNFQSYSIIKVRSAEQKQAIYDVHPQPWILKCDTFLIFLGDLNRAEKAVTLYQEEFHADGVDNLLVTSVDAALVGQNVLLAAESMGYGGVFIGMIRQNADEIASILQLPAYTYPIFGITLGVPKKHNEVKPRLPQEVLVFDEVYKEQSEKVIQDFDQVMTDYAGARQTELWSERIAQQFGHPEHPMTAAFLKEQKLLK
ncbi:NADPH-dependent oxidoreductase [Streptococcus gallolyticus]|nr:NADPH-dependent oxidoreductase [Streptococcus gallolyticus]MBY5040190.1 NADPH-dependent oxidoreductase [Streptococcus gallolyticus]